MNNTRIQLNVTLAPGCDTGDYLIVDTSDEQKYRKKHESLVICDTPALYSSSGNQLNLLFFGQHGGLAGWNATYTTLPM